MKTDDEKREDVLRLLPQWGDEPIAARALHLRLPPPRFSRSALPGELSFLAFQGLVEVLHIGRARYYRRAAELTGGGDMPDTPSWRNQISPVDSQDPLYQKLLPLRSNKPVHLVMNTARRMVRKGQTGTDQQLILIQTGLSVGVDPELILISIVGAGAVLSHPFDKTFVSKLVLAGMPAKLARFLMTQLHRVLRRI